MCKYAWCPKCHRKWAHDTKSLIGQPCWACDTLIEVYSPRSLERPSDGPDNTQERLQ